jgi:hypothetical protein
MAKACHFDRKFGGKHREVSKRFVAPVSAHQRGSGPTHLIFEDIEEVFIVPASVHAFSSDASLLTLVIFQ